MRSASLVSLLCAALAAGCGGGGGEANRPPVLGAIGQRTATEGVPLAFQLTASDPEGAALVFTATGVPPLANLSSTGAFTWTPGFDQAGAHDVTFTVSDGELSDSGTVTIVVQNVNRPPAFTSAAAHAGVAGSPLEFTVTAEDPDGDPVALAITGGVLPAGASFDSSGVFRWTPGPGQTGTYVLTFTAGDGTDAATQELTITVSAAG